MLSSFTNNIHQDLIYLNAKNNAELKKETHENNKSRIQTEFSIKAKNIKEKVKPEARRGEMIKLGKMEL